MAGEEKGNAKELASTLYRTLSIADLETPILSSTLTAAPPCTYWAVSSKLLWELVSIIEGRSDYLSIVKQRYCKGFSHRVGG